MAELNLTLMGPPGAGKGTQAERLIDDFDLPYYATGDILRAAIDERSELGTQAKEYVDRGDLVPDEVICDVIMERIDTPEAEDGFFRVVFLASPAELAEIYDLVGDFTGDFLSRGRRVEG